MIWNRLISWLLSFLFCFLLPLLRCGIQGIILTKFHVPSSVMIGDSTWFNCSFDLQGENLYSIKWYRDEVEFYRYIARDLQGPPDQERLPPIEGIYLDLSRSNLGDIFLNTTDHRSGGIYKCEVSAEGPRFRTVKNSQKLRVISRGFSHFQGASLTTNSLFMVAIILITFKLF
ncbi:uncharacterized protein LOC141857331 [Brevipalpus obovatus]|uniref:uncharacterized protein LOC141857331 n=1 Tax=Brevipalpus obovatus TaxID=246614 RepID=UPI003D9F9F35